ncbi:hypothetical protein [Mitsuokella sp. WILCCON 0060]|uniref:hypothetical protein n=1 Tax=unclassified Mitsuokella TaxID=2637239 RepID=UPI003F0EF728
MEVSINERIQKICGHPQYGRSHQDEKALEAADDWQEMRETELIAKMIANVLWDYKVSSESAKSPDEARKYDNRRAELYAKWKELGFVK